MNKDINREESVQVVRSKYFSTKSAMDESLSDFQEPKKITAPKNTIKKTKPDKPKKGPKRVRGQKDIRTALKTKKTELESYSKDFDHVCRQAGLDVDSDQLQLAIALSKSLQKPTANFGETPETSQSLSSQDRVKKIRTTLLEYGFKVPEIKITTSRRLRKRKHYKLLLTSEETKKQIIGNKYSKVLFENITLSKNSQNIDVDSAHIQLYNLATNATYSILKRTDTFYVEGLLEKSESTGNLLRDWSDIPGRPVSPKLCEPTDMNFSEIECSQDELDIVLSGSLKSCKNVIKNKEREASVSVHKFCEQENLVSTSNLDVIVLIDDDKKSNVNETLKAKEIEIMDLEPTVVDTIKTNYIDIIDLEEPITTVNKYRSCSPDLFEDEPSTVMDDINQTSQEIESALHKIPKAVSAINHVMDLTECVQNRIVKEDHSILTNPNTQLSKNMNATRFNDFMEITECVDIQYVNKDLTIKTSTFKLSQNVTKRKSNDFMEITNCVVSPPHALTIEADVDLTESPVTEKFRDVKIVTNETVEDVVEASDEKTKTTECSQCFNENMEKGIKNIGSKYLDSEGIPKVMSAIEQNNIDLTVSPELVNSNNVKKIANKSIDSLDLTQSSNSSEELPFVSLKTNKKVQSDDTIIIDPKDYEAIEESAVLNDNGDILDLTQKVSRGVHNHDENNISGFDSIEAQNSDSDFNSTQNEQNPEDILDLTQDIVITSRQNTQTSDTNISFFEDYVHNHSDNNDARGEIAYNENFSKDTSSKENVYLDISKSPNGKQNESDHIDLTQNLESPEELSQNFQNKDPSVAFGADSEAAIEMEISDIDLTQHSKSELIVGEDNVEMKIVKSSQRCSSLGKNNDVSIDYDEVYDNLLSRNSDSQRGINSSKSATDIICNTSNFSSKNKDTSNCSQNSDVFVISDNELDYSMHKSKLEKPVDNFVFGGVSIMNELSILASFRKSSNIENNSIAANKNVLPDDNLDYEDRNQVEIDHVRKTPVKHKRVNELATPQKPECSGINTVVTPSNSQYVIKTIDVTPMPKYESMSLEELHSELDKFGVKPFKRRRAVQLLTHIYNQTHPTAEPCSDEESPCKRRKLNACDSPRKKSDRNLTPRTILSPKKTAKSPRKFESNKSPKKVSKKGKDNTKERLKLSDESNERLNDEEVIQTSINYDVNETPVIKDVECSPDDWVFQKKEKAKVHSCRVPLHIAFHNYVSSRRELREAILCYEPINIDDVHKDLVAYGHRYDPKDLLKFMDKKCITVKTTDNDARNQKR